MIQAGYDSRVPILCSSFYSTRKYYVSSQGREANNCPQWTQGLLSRRTIEPGIGNQAIRKGVRGRGMGGSGHRKGKSKVLLIKSQTRLHRVFEGKKITELYSSHDITFCLLLSKKKTTIVYFRLFLKGNSLSPCISACQYTVS